MAGAGPPDACRRTDPLPSGECSQATQEDQGRYLRTLRKALNPCQLSCPAQRRAHAEGVLEKAEGESCLLWHTRAWWFLEPLRSHPPPCRQGVHTESELWHQADVSQNPPSHPSHRVSGQISGFPVPQSSHQQSGREGLRWGGLLSRSSDIPRPAASMGWEGCPAASHGISSAPGTAVLLHGIRGSSPPHLLPADSRGGRVVGRWAAWVRARQRRAQASFLTHYQERTAQLSAPRAEAQGSLCGALLGRKSSSEGPAL